MNTKTIELDIDKRGCNGNCIRIAQGESGGNTIKALVYDNGAEFDLTGYTAYLVARLPDRVHYYKGTATVSGNAATHVCDESKLACVPGYTDEAYFEFCKGSTAVQTERFALDIMRDARAGNAPAQSWDNTIAELEKRGEVAVANVEAAVEKADSAATSANDAASGAKDAADSATTAAGKADSAATSANDAASDAKDAAADAGKAAKEAEESISLYKKVYFTYDAVGDTEFLTLVDEED